MSDLQPQPQPSSSSSPPSSFTFPPEYHFPPFFTRQRNLTTHHAQLVKWSNLVLSYCRHHRILKLSMSGTSGFAMPSPNLTLPVVSSGGNSSSNNPGPYPPSLILGEVTAGSSVVEVDTSELFHNRKLNRRLALADIRSVIDFLRKDGRAEYVSTGKKEPSEGDLAWIYWRTPEEWAGLVEAWVDATGQRGSVLTVYELIEGDGTLGTEFHGLDQELLLKALNVLVKRGKAQIFGQEDSRGVKFF